MNNINEIINNKIDELLSSENDDYTKGVIDGLIFIANNIATN